MRKRFDILVPLMAVLATVAIGATVKQMANLNQFNSGEVSGLLEARTDFVNYNSAARTLQNMIVRSQGPVQRRPGLKWIAEVKDSNDQARLIPFEYSTEDAYAIELGDLYARFFRDGAPVLDANSNIYEIITPWDSNDLFGLQYAQDAEYLRVVHPNYAPYKIWRASANHADWRCEKIKFVDGPFLDDNTQVGVTLTAGSTGAATGYDFYLRPEEASIGIREPWWYGQTFTTSSAYSATGVKVKILRVGALPGEATLSIRATSSSLPTGADLVSATFDANSLTTNVGGEWIEFIFASPLALSNATEYAIILRAVDSTTSEYIRWRADVDPAGYSGGQSVISQNSGASWVAGTADFMFDVSTSAVGSSTTSTTLNASANIFDPLHVGAIWQISHQEDGSTIRGTFTTTEWRTQMPGAADQNSASIDVYEDQDYAMTCTGFWAGTLLIQRSVNNGTTWDTVYAYTKGSQTEPGLVFTGTETEEDAIYRLQMKELVGYRPHRNDWYLSFPYTMIALPFTRQGVVEITSYTDPNTVGVSIRKSLGSLSGTATWAEGAWSDYRGWPRSVEYHEQRCLYGGSRSWPQTIWASITATKDEEYDDFDEGPKNDPAADDSWTYVLPGMSPIQWMRSADFLMVGTTKAVGRLGTETEPITPLVAPPYRTQAKNGSAYIQPVDAVDALLYVERGGEKVRELTYTYASDRFIAPDMTILAEHITGEGLVEIDFQNRPDPILWAIRDDGYALSFTYERKQEVLAWARHNTGQDVNDWNDIDLFESVCVIPGSGTTPSGDSWIEDAVYFVVKRTIDGNDYRLIELLTPLDWGDDEDWAWFVDGGLASGGSGLSTGTSIPYSGEYPTLQALDPNDPNYPVKPTAPTDTPLSGETDISDKAGLQAIADDGHYKLTTNIDCTGAWTPIVDFNGVLDGQGYTISNLTVSGGSNDEQGLFGSIKDGAEIRNLTIQDANIYGRDSVGVLVGHYVDANTSGSIIIHDVNIVDANITGRYYVGGLFGFMDDSDGGVDIFDCTATDVYIDCNGYSGGMLGFMDVTFPPVSDWNYVDCAVVGGEITATESGVGGFSGSIGGYLYTENKAHVYGCSTSMDVNVPQMRGAIHGHGGFTGTILNWVQFSNCTATGSITITQDDEVSWQAFGGFIGFDDGYGSYINCGADVDITCDCSGLLGGINLIGGFVGKWDTNTQGYKNWCLRNYALGDITLNNVEDDCSVDQIAGFGNMIIIGSQGGNVIQRCWAEGDIYVDNWQNPPTDTDGMMGGFMNFWWSSSSPNNVSVNDCYAWGSIQLGGTPFSVYGQQDSAAAGFIGGSFDTASGAGDFDVRNAYAAQTDTAAGSGYVDQLPLVFNYIKGFIGHIGDNTNDTSDQTISMTAVFWDVNTSGLGDGNDVYATGHFTPWMQTRSNYIAAGWDFNDIWQLAQTPVSDSNTWSGMSHLVNTAACVYADGIPRGSVTVDPNGQLNLGAIYTVVIAGLNYYSIYESLPMVNSQTQGRMTQLKDVVIDYYETMGSHVGTSYTYSADLKFSYDNWATGIAPYTGFKGPVGLLSALNRDPTIYIWEWDPLPMCIRSINTTQEITMP